MRFSSITPAVFGAIAATTALIAVPLSGEAQASTSTVTQDRLTPTSMTAGTATTATLTVHSGSCFTAKKLGVGVRDRAGDNLDFPGFAPNVRICPSGTSLTTGSRTLPVGTYTQFGFWQDSAGGWHNLPSRSLNVSGAATTAPTAPTAPSASPVPGQTLAWSEDFNSPLTYGSRWVGSTTSAFAYGNHNPDDNKLDWLSPNAVSVADGVATFTATPSSNTLENGKKGWTTGLLTTEGSAQGFQVKTGDYAETRVQLPTSTGAWPALWTWKNGGGEIDSFEYHPDNPHLLELTNHVRTGQDYYTDANAVAPGKWVTIGTYYGANSVDWYVNGAKVYSDGSGVGANWSAYLILNLSISAGQYHPAPSTTSPITFAADYVHVYR
jgi:hypothetical protein